MNLNLFSISYFRFLKLSLFYGMMLFVLGCVAEKKPATKAVCGEGQAFNEVSRQCFGTRTTPQGTLRNLTVTQDSGKNLINLTFTDNSGAGASACRVFHDNTSSIQVNSPKVYLAAEEAVQLAQEAQSLAVGIPSLIYPTQSSNAITAANAAILEAGVLASSLSPEAMSVSIGSLTQFLRAVANAATLTGSLTYLGPANTLLDGANRFEQFYQDISNRCQCQGGICRTVVVPKEGVSGSSGFSYTVTHSQDGITEPTTVAVTIQSQNRLPLPIHQEAAIFESQTSTPVTEALPAIQLARDSDFADDAASSFFTYTLVSGPSLGTLSGCLGIGGTGRNCNYTPTSGDLSDQNPTTNAFGAVGQVDYQTMRFTSNFRGVAANSISVRLALHQGIGFDPVHSVKVLSTTTGPVIEVSIIEGVTLSSDIVSAINAHSIANELITATDLAPVGSSILRGVTQLTGGTNAQDSFTYRVSDGKGQSLYTGTYNIRIIEQNDFPVMNIAGTVPAVTPIREDTGFILNLAYTDTDSPLLATACTAAPGPNLNVTSACACVAGACTVGVQGTLDYFGSVYVDFTVTNGGLPSSVARKTLTLLDVNDPPTVAPLQLPGNPYSVLEDNVLVIDGLTIDEGDTLGLENSQGVSLRVTVNAADQTIIPQNAANIKIFYNNVNLNFDGTNLVTIPSTVADASAGILRLEFTPAQDMSSAMGSPVRVELFAQDTGSNSAPNSNQQTFDFEIDVVEVDDPPTISTIATVQMNEGGEAITAPFFVDEGGGPNEDIQNLSVQVISDNTVLVPNSNIEVYYDANNNLVPDPSELRGTGGVFVGLGDLATSGDSRGTILRVKPVDGSSGTANLRVIASDGNSTTERTFAVVVHPVGAVHGGWNHISAVSEKEFATGQKNPNQVCSFSPTQCNGGFACTGTVAPNSVVNADQLNAIFYDSANQRCYYAAATGNNAWQELSTYCPISRTSDVPTCSGAACLGSASPIGVVTPTLDTNGLQTPRFYFLTSTQTCYRSTGLTNSDWENYFPTKVTLSWKDFILSGSGADTGVLISGWNVYRRKTGEAYNFNKPVNTAVLTTGTRSYTDTTTNFNTVYYYLVRPIDNKRNIPTATQEIFSEVRVLSPPKNMSFVHRWMVNQEICSKLQKGDEVDTENSFRCAYAGPGETEVNPGDTYYDIGQDLLVDIAEVGCAFSTASNPTAVANCGANGCIGVQDPNTNTVTQNPVDSGLLYYNRSNGTCFRSSTGNVWVEIDSVANADLSVASNNSKAMLLPPLVNITQAKARHFCERRSNISAASIDGVSAAITHRLPSRKEQIAYSAAPVAMSDVNIEQIERGFSLNTSSKCNSSNANGLEFGYTNAQIPSTSFSFSLPGTDASGIRSMSTGSVPVGQSTSTQACLSRYGLQDVYGNVAEWVSDRLRCEDNSCERITPIDGSNDDMSVFDSVFQFYAMDGVRGPCRDVNADGFCNASDAPLTTWRFQDKTFDASFFSFPMGLPIHRLFQVNFPPALNEVSANLLEIGPTSGITVSALHKDAAIVNAEALEKNTSVGGNRTGGMAVGGGYTDGDESGRYTFEMIPSLFVTATQASGGTLVNNAGDASLTFTAVTPGAAGNNISVRLIAGGTAGSETVNVSASSITVFIEDTVSTRNQIRDAITSHPVAGNLVTVVVGGIDSPFDVTEDGGNLTGGFDEVLEKRPDIGFRCVAPVPNGAYTADPLHNALYTGY